MGEFENCTMDQKIELLKIKIERVVAKRKQQSPGATPYDEATWRARLYSELLECIVTDIA